MRGAGHTKKSDGLLGEPKMMRFRFIGEKKAFYPVHRLCKVMAVSQSGYYAWALRPASQRQRDDMVFLAHIRSLHVRKSASLWSQTNDRRT